jgi:anti-sigma factor RsiW
MLERYEDPDPESSEDGLDEYLCEYVDGSMDPAVRDVFEEYLASNPGLAEHVACLCQTRRLLSYQRRCPIQSDTLHHRLHLEIARDLMGEPHGTPVWAVPGLGSFAALTSAVGLILLFGVLFGSALIRVQGNHGQVEKPFSTVVLSDSQPVQIRRVVTPSESPAQLGLPAPLSTLPIVASSSAMTPLMGPDEFDFEPSMVAAP